MAELKVRGEEIHLAHSEAVVKAEVSFYHRAVKTPLVFPETTQQGVDCNG